MKYENYETYLKEATEYYSSNKELKIPLEYMILSKHLFDIFNGVIDFGPGAKELVNTNSDAECKNCQCKNKKECEATKQEEDK